MRNATDQISNAIEAAAERIFERQVQQLERMLPRLIREAMSSLSTPQPKPVLDGQRFYSIKAAAERLGVSRSSILRYEREGKMPARRKLPSGRTGWLGSDIDGFLGGLEPIHSTRDRVN